MKSGVTKVIDKSAGLLGALKKLPKQDVCIGIPEDTSGRAEEDSINNATIGYIAEHGAPEKNIPARPWLVPSITAAKPRIIKYMKQAGKAALEGKPDVMKRALEAAGITGETSARKLVNAGIAPALADSTLKARARRGKGAAKGIRLAKGAAAELAARAGGAEPSTENAKPLVDTGNFRKAISYVVRQK